MFDNLPRRREFYWHSLKIMEMVAFPLNIEGRDCVQLLHYENFQKVGLITKRWITCWASICCDTRNRGKSLPWRRIRMKGTLEESLVGFWSS